MLPRYKDIVELIKKGATVEAQEKILELREAALELQEENIELKGRIKELEKKIDLKESLEWESPYYWKVNDGAKDGPFCQNCWDADQKLIRLQQPHNPGFWSCHSCGKNVTDKNYREPDSFELDSSSPFDDF